METTTSSINLLIEALYKNNKDKDNDGNDMKSNNPMYRKNILNIIKQEITVENNENKNKNNNNDIINNDFFKKNGLGDALLYVISNDISESCRELATSHLHFYLQKLYQDNDDATRMETKQEHELLHEANNNITHNENHSVTATISKLSPLSEFYMDFCTIFSSKMSFDTNTTRSSRSTTNFKESSEEIRFLYIQIISELISLLFPNNNNIIKSNKQPIVGSTNPEKIKECTSITLCPILTKNVLLYESNPTSQRECCLLIQKLCTIFPNIIRMHAEAFLYPLTGCCNTATTAMKDSRRLKGTALIRHRHTKTRCIVIETCASLLSCCSINNQEDKNTGVVLSSSSSLSSYGEEIAINMIVPAWFHYSIVDISPTVRLTLFQVVIDMIITAFKQQLTTTNTSKKSKVYPWFILILFMGMTDDVQNIQMEIQHQIVEKEENKKLFSDLVEKYLLDMFSIIVHDTNTSLSHTWMKNRKVVTLRTLKELFRWIPTWEKQNVSSSYNTTTNTDESQKKDTLLYHELMYDILTLLMECINDDDDDDDDVCRAAKLCCQELGRYCTTTTLVFDFFLPPLMLLCNGGNTHSNHDDDDAITSSKSSINQTKKKFILSTPRQISSVLFILAEVIRSKDYKKEQQQDQCTTIDCFHDSKIPCQLFEILCHVYIMEQVVKKDNENDTMLVALFTICQSIVQTIDSGSSLLSITTTITPKDRSMNHEENFITGFCLERFLLCFLPLLGSSSSPTSITVNENAKDLLDKLVKSITSSNAIDRNDSSSISSNRKVLLSSGRDLLGIKFRYLITSITKSNNEADSGTTTTVHHYTDWKSNSYQFIAFDALLRHCNSNDIWKNFHLIAPVFKAVLSKQQQHDSNTDSHSKANDDDVSTSYQIQLQTMALLQTIVSNVTSTTTTTTVVVPSQEEEADDNKIDYKVFLHDILQTNIFPNLIWRAGGNASALRKISSATLYSILQTKSIVNIAYLVLSQEHLPAILSNLSDYDSSTRQLLCSSLDLCLQTIVSVSAANKVKQERIKVHDECVHLLCTELLKLLDDSNDHVRFQACSALKSFLHAVAVLSPCPKNNNGKGESTKMMIDLIETLLFIHLDDSIIQEEVYLVLLSVIVLLGSIIDNETFRQKIIIASRQICSTRGKELCQCLFQKVLEVSLLQNT